MNSKNLLFLIILLVACAAQIASDIYAPSIPAIAAYLHTSIASIQFSMALYMFGLAVSQLVYGPLSEGLGRKIPLIAGLTILLIGNLLSLSAHKLTTLMVGRLLQGCGAGACAALWRSIFRDIFTGTELAKYGAYFSIFVTFMVPAAPAIGGYLQEYFNWRASFAFLAIYSLVTLLMVLLGLKETNLHCHVDRLKAQFISESFKHILTSSLFMGYTLCTFLCYGAFFAWFAVGPVLLIHIVGINPITFGWITLFGGGIATAFGSWINGKTVTKYGTHTMLRIGFSLMFIAGLLMLLGKILFGINAVAIVAPMLLFYSGVTFIWPSAFAGAFGPFGKTAGYAGALYGFMQISGAAVIGAMVAYLPHQNQVPLALVFISASISAWLVFEKIVRAKEKDIK